MGRKKKQSPSMEIDMTAAGVTANRIRAVMGWPLDVIGSTGFLFKAWRAVGTGEALAISLEKVNEIAAELESCRAAESFYKLTVAQRDAAWQEIERLKEQISVMEAGRRVD